MRSTNSEALPVAVRSAENTYEALSVLKKRGFIDLDLATVDARRYASDGPALRRILDEAKTVGEFLKRLPELGAEFGCLIERLDQVGGRSSVWSGNDEKQPQRPQFLQPMIPWRGSAARTSELAAAEIVLSKRTRNNLLVCGPAGSGKTALVELIAETRPELGPFWRVDSGALVGGTKHRGELEERLRDLYRYALATGSVMFIDEIHALARMGVAEGSISALDVLKPYLVDPHFRVIGATTTLELPFVIADPAFHRRFSVLHLKSLTREQLRTVFTDYLSSSLELVPLKSSFDAIIEFVDVIRSDTSRVDAMLDFLEHGEAWIRVHGASGIETSALFKSISSSYEEFRACRDPSSGQHRRGGEG